MDEIEAGFKKLADRIREREQEKGALAEKVRGKEAELLSRMARTARPLIPAIGMNMLLRGKQDTKGELYDTAFFPKKMIVLGKTDPAEFRPDNATKKVDDQFCVLSEDGKIYELMYSFDGFLVDSYLQEISPREAVSRYGVEILYMLYAALHDYLKGQDELVGALKVTLDYMTGKGKKEA
ncbi:MAG: hypothetical protein GKC05_00305 [Methanomicrobiales archaeon]|nr:hypothetical protein [Methanomicrobiales archaeon]NYT21363.1 hypothetical protein [Methanomicrobiales archaeon]